MTDGKKKCYMTDRVKFSKVILSQENVYGRSSTNKWLQEPCRWSIPHLAMDFWEIVFVTESSLFQRTSIIKYTLNNSTVTILEIWNPSTRHIYTYIQIYILILFQQMIWNDHISNDIYIYGVQIIFWKSICILRCGEFCISRTGAKWEYMFTFYIYIKAFASIYFEGICLGFSL